ncbi:MAG: hypothetical protein M3N56_00155 [Actinomycetota bacterium]|nr:hypothetical protein [Actinomycetota bacterium]
MRRLLVCGIAAAGMAVAAPSAAAAPANILAGDPAAANKDLFNPTAFSHEAGTVATLTWVAGGSHDAIANGSGPDGRPLFRSDLIGEGTTPVEGSQYVSGGSYPFFCTIHAGMTATLDVAGTPLPRPEVRVKVKSKSLAQVLRAGKIRVKLTIAGGGGEDAAVALRLGKKTISSSGSTNRAVKTKTLGVALTSKGRAALEKRSKATIKAEASIEFGSPAKAKATLK